MYRSIVEGQSTAAMRDVWQVDPVFVAQGNYRLRGNSPAIDRKLEKHVFTFPAPRSARVFGTGAKLVPGTQKSLPGAEMFAGLLCRDLSDGGVAGPFPGAAQRKGFKGFRAGAELTWGHAPTLGLAPQTTS